MFFDSFTEIPKIAKRTSCTIFVVPPETELGIKATLTLEPEAEKSKTRLISADSLRDFLSFTDKKLTSDQFFIIREADKMSEVVQNIFLKTLEEPKEFCHFVMTTNDPAKLLPTILSRAQVFIPRMADDFDKAPDYSKKVMGLAKELISAKTLDLPKIAAKIATSKPQPRQTALDSTSAATEILYKSYLKTGNRAFLAKIPKFMQLHQALQQNGHIKLHIIASLC